MAPISRGERLIAVGCREDVAGHFRHGAYRQYQNHTILISSPHTKAYNQQSVTFFELFRPPRYVAALSILVTLAALSAMAWLGWELLRRERALDAQRALDALESAADHAVSA